MYSDVTSKVSFLQAPIIVKKFKNHTKYKNELLDLINKHKSTGPDGREISVVSRTDWYVDTGCTRDYWSLIKDDIEEHMVEIYKSIGMEILSISNYWFQQYYKNDYHNLHIHRGSMFNNVYYVELDKSNPGTSIESYSDNSFTTPDVEEGDILTFPSIFYHTSFINNSDLRKTIISFNVN